ncbi:hypothetical protein, conserved [Eimeria maxima]|uniref:Uncharacterized protein n=1 Tax=Eimeria maxima TaxID=5804 RepID=U6MEL6_EIMMA|nr:hypothetical protein, conserved [Eimeria maxima]CDJ60090.1 hypothetical protein, conserved [Eimeria maxima]
MPSKPPKGKARGKKAASKAAAARKVKEPFVAALGHPPALGAWRPLPLEEQIDAFAAAAAAGPNARGVLSSGKPAAPHYFFLPSRSTVAAVGTEDAAAGAAATGGAALAGKEGKPQHRSAPLNRQGAAATTTEKKSAAADATLDPSAAASTAAAADDAALRGGCVHVSSKFNSMLATLNSLQQKLAEQASSSSSSSSIDETDPTAISDRVVYTELQRLLLLLQQPNALRSHLRHLDDVYKWYQKFCCPEEQQQQQQQQKQQKQTEQEQQQQELPQQQQEEPSVLLGGSPLEPATIPLPGSAFWQQQLLLLQLEGDDEDDEDDMEDYEQLEEQQQQQEQQQQPEQQQQQQPEQQQQQTEQQTDNAFYDYIMSHIPICTAADKLRLYRMKLLFRPSPAKQQQQQQQQHPESSSSSSTCPFDYKIPCGNTPWGLVLPRNEDEEEETPEVATRPLQYQYQEGSFARSIAARYPASDRRSLVEAQLHQRWFAARQREHVAAEKEAEKKEQIAAWQTHRDAIERHVQGTMKSIWTTVEPTTTQRAFMKQRYRAMQQRHTVATCSPEVSPRVQNKAAEEEEEDDDPWFDDEQQQLQQHEQKQQLLQQQRHHTFAAGDPRSVVHTIKPPVGSRNPDGSSEGAASTATSGAATAVTTAAPISTVATSAAATSVAAAVISFEPNAEASAASRRRIAAVEKDCPSAMSAPVLQQPSVFDALAAYRQQQQQQLLLLRQKKMGKKGKGGGGAAAKKPPAKGKGAASAKGNSNQQQQQQLQQQQLLLLPPLPFRLADPAEQAAKPKPKKRKTHKKKK